MKRSYILFGCGGFLYKRLEEIEKVINIVCVCDNNRDLWGKKWLDKYDCISPAELMNYFGYEVLISVEKEDVSASIKAQLNEMNIICRHLNDALSEVWLENHMPLDVELRKMMEMKSPRIILLGAPAHSNLGDQAQTYCIQSLVRKIWPERGVAVFEGNPLRKNYYYLLYFIRKIIAPEDILFVHSGYHCTDLFQKEEDLNEKIVRLFPERKIVFFPQTIHFKSEDSLERSKKIYNSHGNLTIMCRDEVSYGLAKEYYTKCKLILMPDVVTSLIGRRSYSENRKGIMLCLRGAENEESNITEEQKQLLINKLTELREVKVTDTDSPLKWSEIREKRGEVIEKEIAFYSQFELIVTDRYHGMIFSLIANTPVIVIPSSDHKLSSGVRWFPKEIYKKISLITDCSEIWETARKLLCEDKVYENPPYLYNRYFADFKKYLVD